MVAGDADDDALGRRAGGALGLADGLLDGRDGLVDVDHDAAVEAVGLGDADAADRDAAVAVAARHDGADLGRPDVDADDEALSGGGDVVHGGRGRETPRAGAAGRCRRRASTWRPGWTVKRCGSNRGARPPARLPDRRSAGRRCGRACSVWAARTGPKRRAGARAGPRRRSGRCGPGWTGARRPASSRGTDRPAPRHSTSDTSAPVAASAEASAASVSRSAALSVRSPGATSGTAPVSSGRSYGTAEEVAGRVERQRHAVGVEEARRAAAAHHEHDRDALLDAHGERPARQPADVRDADPRRALGAVRHERGREREHEVRVGPRLGEAHDLGRVRVDRPRDRDLVQRQRALPPPRCTDADE